jgi:putative membrane protein
VLAQTFAVPAGASTISEQQQGAAILQSLDSGKTKCADLSNDDFDHVGEYVMFRMAGSTAAHEQMNQLMQRMMGTTGESQMHIVMGKRFSGCGGGAVPSSFGGMMGMMGAMSGFQGGGGSGRGGSMMGGGSSYRNSGSDENNGWSTADSVMVGLMVLTLLALTVVAVALLRRSPGGSSAREILAGRYAKGEIDKDEYQRRLDAMGGD